MQVTGMSVQSGDSDQIGSNNSHQTFPTYWIVERRSDVW